MELSIRRWFTQIEHKLEEAGHIGEPPLRKVASIAIIANPYAGEKVNDLSPLITASSQLGSFLSKLAIEAMGPYAVQSYGKGGVVGMAGEIEHINALVTTTFATPLREATGGGKAWISSFTKRGGLGTSIDIPLAHKDALYVRSHYDGMSITLHEAPAEDEIAVIFCIANRGRIGARVGGLHVDEVQGKDGLY
ncbi:amino acid synthesis family protein [soil metagenome]